MARLGAKISKYQMPDYGGPGGGHNSPNFAWLGLYCTVNFVEKCFLMTELVS